MSKAHMNRVAAFGAANGCVVCGEQYAHLHHIIDGRTPGRRSSDWLVIPLCYDCHEGADGIHGTRLRWALRKDSELKALARTLEGIYG